MSAPGGVPPPTWEAFLRYGVLPENLPAPFSTSSLIQAYKPDANSYLVTGRVGGSLSQYSASKRGGQRRLFALPHPTFIHDQTVFLNKQWPAISAVLDTSSGSLSKPMFSATGPRATRITPHSELPKARLKAFSRFKYCAITDVARCYPSIYTHSIPWAINGRDNAKLDKSNYSSAVFGNRLDFIFRQAQEAQTVGLPVGPDTSRVVAEVILSSVDANFLSRYGSKKPTYIRHVDDYWIGGDTVDDCERHLQNLRAALRDFELDLNDLKTRVVQSNTTLGDAWPMDFERMLKRSFGPKYFQKEYDPIAALSIIIERANKENDDGMIRHAIRKIDDNTLWDNDWDTLEHFLAHCAVHFPHAFDYVARVIIWRIRTGKSFDKVLWKDVTLTFAHQSSALGKDAEVLWSLWLASELKLKLPISLTDSLVLHNKPLVLGFLAHMFSHGQTRDKGLGDKLAAAVTGNPYSGHCWPLALELTALNIGGVNLAGHVQTEEPLKRLHDQGISIVNWGAMPAVFQAEAGVPIAKPSYAIEDYTSDYDDDIEIDGDEDEIEF